jgi:predicted phosphoadenosine phosphosulfate sulfurtransferase
MSKLKHYTGGNVYDAAMDRLDRVYSEFDRVYLSCSFGKDSSALAHMAAEVARKHGKLPVHLLFIDLEGQYQSTIRHADEMFARDEFAGHWVCLPLNLRNAVSQYQPFWTCWDPADEDKWIRPLPENEYVVNDPTHFPWFRHGMEFEQFVPLYGEWFAGGHKTACMVAIRTDESLNRFRTIASTSKERWNDYPWTTKTSPTTWNAYPIYDWRTEDIWTAVGRNRWSYNRIYDMMHLAGVSIHHARICQPYGDDQRRGLDLFHRCEPETWYRVVDRVTGANFGSKYARSALLGFRKMELPPGHTWRSYAEFLLSTLPRYEQEWYGQKFERFLWWWDEYHGIPVDEIPDEGLPALEADHKVPSWRRIARVLMTNDKLCKSLSFGQSVRQWDKYVEMMEKYGE